VVAADRRDDRAARGGATAINRNRKRILALGGLLISAAFLWFALRDTDFAQVGASLAAADPWMLLPMLFVYGLHYVIKAVRWRLLLAPSRATTARALFRPMMLGFFGNNVLPAHLGELVRMYLGSRQLNLRKSEVLATIVLERMFDFLSVVFFLGVVLVLGRDVPEDLLVIGYVTAIAGLASLLVAALFATWTARFLAVVRAATGFLPHRLRDAGLHQLEVAALGLRSVRRPALLAGIVTTSILQWGLMGAAIYASLHAVGIDLRPAPAFVVLAATTFGVTLPAAPGFLGTVQAAFVLALVPYGVASADAFAASAFFHVPTYLAVTLFGLWLLKGSGYDVGRLQREAESAADD
jgi:uncharacterized protein (TIRG00374 family)